MAVINFKVLPASSAAASAAAAAANSIYNCHMMAMEWDRLQPCTLKAFVPGAACGISRALKLAFTTIVDPPKANLTRPRPNSRTAKFSPNSAYISLLAWQAKLQTDITPVSKYYILECSMVIWTSSTPYNTLGIHQTQTINLQADFVTVGTQNNFMRECWCFHKYILKSYAIHLMLTHG